jgi:hypothetical protein
MSIFSINPSDDDLTPVGDASANTNINRSGDVVPGPGNPQPSSFWGTAAFNSWEDLPPRKHFSSDVKELAMRSNALYGSEEFPRGICPILWALYQRKEQVTWNNVRFHHLRSRDDTDLESCAAISAEGHALYHDLLRGKIPLDLMVVGRYDELDNEVELDELRKRARDFMEARAHWAADNYKFLLTHGKLNKTRQFINLSSSYLPGFDDL